MLRFRLRLAHATKARHRPWESGRSHACPLAHRVGRPWPGEGQQGRGLPSFSMGNWGSDMRHPSRAARIGRSLFGGRDKGSPEYRLVRWLFLRLTGGIFLIAFTSLGRQVLGLYGARGISPVRELVGSERLREMGAER